MMKTREQILERIEQLLADRKECGERKKSATSQQQHDLLSNEMFAINNQIIALKWVTNG